MLIISSINILGLKVDESQLLISILAAIAGVFVWIATQIFKLGQLTQRITTVESAIKEDLKPELKEISRRLLDLSISLGGKDVTTSNSPRVLNDAGRKILEESGVKEIIEKRFDEIVSKVKEQNPKNAYQGELSVIDAVRSMATEDKDVRDDFEQGAFRSGTSVATLSIVGGVHIRDRVFTEIGLNPKLCRYTMSANLWTWFTMMDFFKSA